VAKDHCLGTSAKTFWTSLFKGFTNSAKMSEIPTTYEPVLSLDSTRIGNCEWDIIAGTMEWNNRMHGPLGLEPGLFSGSFDDFLKHFDSSDHDRLARKIAAWLERRGDFGCQFRNAPFYTYSLEMRFETSADAEDKSHSMMIFCWDAGECHRITEVRASEQHLLSALMNNLPDLIYFEDRESRFTTVNQMFPLSSRHEEPFGNHWSRFSLFVQISQPCPTALRFTLVIGENLAHNQCVLDLLAEWG
jgi:hypothetical protein